MNEFIARQAVKDSREDLYIDKAFVKHLVSAIQSVDPDIGAFIIPDTKMVIFFSSTYEIVIYKLLLNELNINDITIVEHKNKVKEIMTILNANLIPYKDLLNLQKSAAKLNLKAIKQL